MKLPAFQFYPGDWLRDGVSGCSLAAQGLWLRLMILMHDSERYGYLCYNGLPIPSAQLARRCGCTLAEYEELLAELESAGVPSRTKDGIIYSRRMTRDAEERTRNAERQRRHYQSKKQNPNTKPNTQPNTQPNTNLTAISQKPNITSSSSSSNKKEIERSAPRSKSPPDERSNHKAIQSVRKIIGHYPEKVNYDEIIQVLGTDFDEGRLNQCGAEWAKRGFNLRNLGWVFDWYPNGIPKPKQTVTNAGGRGLVL